MIGKALQLTCKYTGLSKNDILSSSRQKHIVDAKQTVAIVLHKNGMTMKEIARNLRYDDHTSILHLLNKRPIQDERLLSRVLGAIQTKRHHTNNLTTLID